MGFWGCRSFDNDQVHDQLNWAGRIGGKGFDDCDGLTKDMLERYLIHQIQPVLMDEKEQEIQIALGSMPLLGEPIYFLGIVIWGLNRKFRFQSLILDAALAAGYTLLRDEKGLRQWKHPKSRKKWIAKEIFMITKKNLAIYRDRNFIQDVVQKFRWEVNSRY